MDFDFEETQQKLLRHGGKLANIAKKMAVTSGGVQIRTQDQAAVHERLISAPGPPGEPQ